MATYDSLHRQCRTLESLFDAKLTSYSRLASTISRNDTDVEANGSGERWKDLQNEVEDLLENVRLSYCYLSSTGPDLGLSQLNETNDQLSVLLNDTSNPPSPSMSRAIQRHRDVYQDYARELKRTKVCLNLCQTFFVLTECIAK